MKRSHRIIQIMSICNLLWLPFAALAQTDIYTQTGTADVLPSTTVTMQPPENFSFPQVFAPASGETQEIYRVLSPSIPEEQLQIGDTDTGATFTITLSATNFISQDNPTDIIPYTNLGFVILSESLTDPIDSHGSNNPPGATNVNVTPGLYCSWDINDPSITTLEDGCAGQMNFFTVPAGPSPVSQEITLVTNPSTADTGGYSMGFGLYLQINDTIVPADYTGVINFTLIVS